MEHQDDNISGVSERRAYVRIRREAHAKCLPARRASIKSTLSARVLEVGVGGMRLALTHELQSGAEIEITVDDPGVEKCVLRANVAWARWDERRRRFETGAEFLDLNPREHESLLRLIGRANPDELQEQRRLVRLNVELPVRIKPRGKWLARGVIGATANLGPGGLAVITAKPCEANAVCNVEIFFNQRMEGIMVEALVLDTRRRPDGKWLIRLRFSQIEDSARRKIRHFLAEHMRGD